MTLDTHQSVFREHLLEHLVLGELLKHSWFNDSAALEISHPSIDRAGYDVILESNSFIRHVQFKSSARTAKTSRQNTKGNAEGVKLERPSLRVLPQARFSVLDSIPDLHAALFGAGATVGSARGNPARF